MPEASQSGFAPALDARAIDALAESRNFSTGAVRLLLRTKEILLLAKGLALGEWRESRDPVSGAFAEHCQAEVKCAELREALAIIRGRIIRMPAARRKRYSPEERYRVVVFVRTHCLTLADAAEMFLVDAQTIGRWTDEATRDPNAKTIGSLLKATPPLRSTSDVTRELVTLLDSLAVGGSRKIAQMLVRAGAQISRESVRRLRKRKPPKLPPQSGPLKKELAVPAKTPNHVWMADLTLIPSFLRIWTFRLAVILDVYSRYPLGVARLFGGPSSAQMEALVSEANAKHGNPSHFITDRGSQFTGAAFTTALADLGIRQRFGAVGQSGSIAIIERFWRTMKELLDVRFLPPLSQTHLEDRVSAAIEYYSTLRTHQGIGGATPAEKYFGTATPEPLIQEDDARSTSPRDGPLPVTVAFFANDRRMPYLVANKRAA